MLQSQSSHEVSQEQNSESANEISVNQQLPRVDNFDIEEESTETSAPIEMNTYVQLEIDNNNHACIPRILKFCITKLSLKSEFTSVILATKLETSKRSIRTMDIALKPELKETSLSADLKLNYNIAYPHFLKKDTNFIYFCIQKRKKLKNRTILGFKTLAFTAIDLSLVLQKPLTTELALFYFNSNSSINSNLANIFPLNNNVSNRTVIGSIKIQSLTSSPIDCLELENNFNHFNRNFSTESSKPSELNENDDYELDIAEKYLYMSGKNEADQLKEEVNRESDIENEASSKKTKEDEKTNAKNFTGKILSFIKKFRNENVMGNNLEEENEQNEDALIDEEEEDYELDSIDQVSDFDNSETENDTEADLYSIVSTPKPKLEPFFKNNSNPDLRSDCDFY